MLWFGLLGAPLAWVLQHLLVVWVAEATCDVGGGGIAPDRWLVIGTIGGAAVAVGALACSIVTRRATRESQAPPGSRIHFLATIGMTISPLFLMIILMDGLGFLALVKCHQS